MTAGAGVVAVTGASGFVGTHVCAALVVRGWRVRAVVRGTGAPLNTERHAVRDVLDRAGLARALCGADAVVHLAARVHVMHERSADPAAEYRRVNVEGTGAVLEAAAAAGVKAVVVASSVKAVGEGGDRTWTAVTRPVPADPYGASKLEAERIALAAGAQHGLRVVVLRFPVIYGPGMGGNMLRLFALVRRGAPLPLGAVANRRSLAYVGNAVFAITGVLGAAGARGTFFVSDGEDVATPDLIRRIARALDTRARLIAVPPVLLRAAGRAGDLAARVMPMPLTSAAVARLLGSLTVDATPLRAVIGPPPFGLDEGLLATADWLRGGPAR